jgi:hypothetical protein
MTSLAHSELDTATLGTRDPRHMTSNINITVNRLPTSAELIRESHRRFDSVVSRWSQLGQTFLEPDIPLRYTSLALRPPGC